MSFSLDVNHRSLLYMGIVKVEICGTHLFTRSAHFPSARFYPVFLCPHFTHKINLSTTEITFAQPFDKCINSSNNVQDRKISKRWGLFTIYMGKPFGSRFGQLVSQIPYCDIPFRTGVLPFAQIPLITERVWNWYQWWGLTKWNTNFRWNIPSGKTGFSFQTFRYSRRIFHSNDPKSRVPFAFQPKFQETLCKW